MPCLGIVVPCYNEEDNIFEFYNAIDKVFEKSIEEKGFSYKIIFVDDGSTDNTLQRIKELANKNEKITYLSFSRNFGKEAAILAGLENLNCEFMSIMDVDLQDPPQLLTDMIDILNNNPDIDCVAAKRVSREHEGVIRSFFSVIFYKIINNISDTKLENGVRDFRVMRSYVKDALLSLGEKARFTKGIFSWIGFKTEYLEYKNIERKRGKTKWSFKKLYKYALDGIISFSTVPLALSSVLGGIFCCIAVVMLIYLLIMKIFNKINIEGYALIVCSLWLIGGIQLFTIGILSKYVEKIFLETKNRPIYIIKEFKDSRGTNKC